NFLSDWCIFNDKYVVIWGESTDMKADARTEKEVMEVLNRFINAYQKRDLAGILKLFSPDPDVVFYGNGEDEKSLGLSGIREQAEHDWSQGATLSLEVKWFSVSSA